MGGLPVWGDAATGARWVAAAAIAAWAARRGLRRASLSPSGAAAALTVGFIALGSAWMFGVLLLSFYFTGSAFTKYKAAMKTQWDIERREGEGQRDAYQVLATAGCGTALCLLYIAAFGLEQPPLPALRVGVGACIHSPLAAWWHQPDVLLTALTVAYVSTYAMVTGDTWASELGILSTAPPRFILPPWRRVPKGTNGGVSAWGTIASAMGGTFIGVLAWACACLPTAMHVAMAGNGVPLGQVVDALRYGPTWAGQGGMARVHQGWLVVVGLFGGVVGSVVDSVLGGMAQTSFMHLATGKVSCVLPPGAVVATHMTYDEWASKKKWDGDGERAGAPPAASEGSKASGKGHRGGSTGKGSRTATSTDDRLDGFVRVSGWDVLSNEAVNATSASLIAIVAAVAYLRVGCHLA